MNLPAPPPVFIEDSDLQGCRVDFRPLGATQVLTGRATGRVTNDLVEVEFFQPVRQLVPRSRIHEIIQPAQIVDISPIRDTPNRHHHATGWIEERRGRHIYLRRVGSKKKSTTLETQAEFELVKRLIHKRQSSDRILAMLQSFRQDYQSALDTLASKQLLSIEEVARLLTICK